METILILRRLAAIRAAGQAVGSGIEERVWSLGLWYDVLGLMAILGMLLAAWCFPCGVLE